MKPDSIRKGDWKENVFSDKKIKESDEDKPGIILDYDKDGSIVGIEILDASKKMKFPAKVEYEVA